MKINISFCFSLVVFSFYSVSVSSQERMLDMVAKTDNNLHMPALQVAKAPHAEQSEDLQKIRELFQKVSLSDNSDKNGFKLDFDLSNMHPTDMILKSSLSGSNNAEATYYWDFGDGSYGTGTETRHFFKRHNRYEIRLIAVVKKKKETIQLSKVKYLEIN